MTPQEFDKRLDEILNSLSDSSASRGWLDCKSGSEDTYPRQDLVGIAKQAIRELLVEVVEQVRIDGRQAGAKRHNPHR